MILRTSSIGSRPSTTLSASGSTAAVSDSPALARSVPMSVSVRAARTLEARNGNARPVIVNGDSSLSRASPKERRLVGRTPGP